MAANSTPHYSQIMDVGQSYKWSEHKPRNGIKKVKPKNKANIATTVSKLIRMVKIIDKG